MGDEACGNMLFCFAHEKTPFAINTECIVSQREALVK